MEAGKRLDGSVIYGYDEQDLAFVFIGKSFCDFITEGFFICGKI